MILIDPPSWEARGRMWSHLASDTSYAELHEYAERLGVHPFAFDGDHYDVPGERYDEMRAAGAVEQTSRQILRALQDAGLRFTKRRGDRPVAALIDAVPFVPVPHRVDLVLSDREPPGPTVAAVTFVQDDAGRVLLVEAPKRAAWEGPGGWREPGESPRETAARELGEEVGLHVRPHDLTPVAYERITLHEPLTTGFAAGRLGPVSHIAVHHLVVDGVTAALPSVGPEGHPLGWFDVDGLRERCAEQVWWPLLARVLDIDRDRRYYSTPRV